MTSFFKSLPVLALLCSVTFAAGHEAPSNWIGFQTHVLVLDVACDGRTWGAIPIPDLKRGDPFIVDGKIFPGGTIESGGTFAEPGPFDPDAEGNVGQWTCRGHSYVGYADLGTNPTHSSTIQDFVFDSATRLATMGHEGGAPFNRVIIGGAGKYRGMIGEVLQEPIGVNATGFPNFRMTFTYTMIPFASVPVADTLDHLATQP